MSYLSRSRWRSFSFCTSEKESFFCPEVPTGEQQRQTERDEVVAVTGGPEGLLAQGLGEGAQALDR